MEARARFLGHAVHPMLIVFPLGLLTTAFVFDALWYATDREAFAVAGAYAIAAGVLGGLVAALFGWVDWFAVPRDTRAKRIGLWHGLGNMFVLGLFAVAWLVRFADDGWAPDGVAMALEGLGVVIAGVTGWLGGELVERLSVSVFPDAGLDASSSLSRDEGDGQQVRREEETRRAAAG